MAVTLIQAALTLSLTLQDSEDPESPQVSSSDVQATLSTAHNLKYVQEKIVPKCSIQTLYFTDNGSLFVGCSW